MTGTTTPKPEETKSSVEFVNQPGGGAMDELFGFEPSAAPKTDPKDEGNAFGFEDDLEDDQDDDQGQDEEEDDEDEGGQPSTLDQATLDRLAALEQQNATLMEQVGQMSVARQTQTINDLMSAYTEAVQFGDDDKAAELQAKILEAKTAAPNAPAGPKEVPAAMRAEAKAWLDKQSWYGTDTTKTARLQEVVNLLDPMKFANTAAYLQAVEAHVNGGTQQPQPRTSRRGSRQQPASEPTPAPRRNKGTGEVTAINQLKGAEQEAARTAMRIGKLTEEQYLKSYNDTKKMVAARRRK